MWLASWVHYELLAVVGFPCLLPIRHVVFAAGIGFYNVFGDARRQQLIITGPGLNSLDLGPKLRRRQLGAKTWTEKCTEVWTEMWTEQQHIVTHVIIKVGNRLHLGLQWRLHWLTDFLVAALRARGGCARGGRWGWVGVGGWVCG